MKQQQRFILALVASAAVLILWNYFFPPPKPAATAMRMLTRMCSRPPRLRLRPTAQATATVDSTPAQGCRHLRRRAPDSMPQRKLRIVTPLYEATFDTRGAVATSWILKKVKKPDGTEGSLCGFFDQK